MVTAASTAVPLRQRMAAYAWYFCTACSAVWIVEVPTCYLPYSPTCWQMVCALTHSMCWCLWVHEFLRGQLVSNTCIGTCGLRSCSPCHSMHTQQHALCMGVQTSFPRGAELHIREQRVWGWLCCVLARWKGRSCSTEGLCLSPSPFSSASLQGWISHWVALSWTRLFFPGFLWIWSSESLSIELAPAAFDEKSAVAAMGCPWGQQEATMLSTPWEHTRGVSPVRLRTLLESRDMGGVWGGVGQRKH